MNGTRGTILPYVFALLGIGMLAGGIYLYDRTKDFLDQAVTAPGIVIELKQEKSSDSNNNTTYDYRPVVQFDTKDGQRIVFTSDTATNPPSYHTEDEVEVIYNPKEPLDAKINTFFSLWLGVILLLGLGAIFTIVGVNMFYSRL